MNSLRRNRLLPVTAVPTEVPGEGGAVRVSPLGLSNL